MVDRLFQIVYTLMNSQSVTVAALAEKFECSKRTIMRDLDKLSVSGVPIYTNRGRKGGISLLPGYVLDRTYLSEEEKKQILASLQAIQATSYEWQNETQNGVMNESQNDAQNNVQSKLISLFGEDEVDWIEIDFSGWGDHEKEEAYFRILKTAILQRQMIQIQYIASHKEQEMRRIKPLKLCFRGNAWYLYGYCMLREDYRFFKLGRILELEVLEDTFTPVFVGKVLQQKLPKEGSRIRIRLQVEKEILYRTLEELPKGELLGDGSMIVEFEAEKGAELNDYLLSLGASAKILAPVELQQEFCEIIRQMNKKYE